MTVSSTGQDTICGMPSTPPSFAANSAGSLGTTTSSRGLLRRSGGIGTTRIGGRPLKTPPKRSTPDSASDRGDAAMTDFGKPLQAQPTPVPGLTVWTLPIHGDNRGWFKENWQREKMVA